MADTVDVPGMGGVKKEWIIGGAALVVGIVGFAWWRAGTSGGSGPEAPAPTAAELDPAYNNPRAGETSPDPVGALAPRTNPEWTARVSEALAGVGFDPAMIATTLGRFLGRQQLTASEADVVRSGMAYVGRPPEGSYTVMLAPAGSTTPPATPPSSTTKPPATPAKKWGPRGSDVIFSRFAKDHAEKVGRGADWDSVARYGYPAALSQGLSPERVRSALAVVNRIPRPWIRGYRMSGWSWGIPVNAVVYYPRSLRV